MSFAGCSPPGEAGAERERVLLHPRGDVLAVGPDVQLQEAVSGDAMAAGGSVVFDGFVGGSYLGAGGEQDVRGRIDGSIRAVGGTVRLGADVGRNVTAAGGNVTLEPEGHVVGNAYVAGGTVRLAGLVDGDVYVGAREVILDAEVGGDVRVEAERLSVGPDARIAGGLRYRTGDAGADIDVQARIAGPIEELPPREAPRPGSGLGFALFRLLAFLATGTVLVALFPAAVRGVVSGLPTGWAASLGYGTLTLLAVPLAVMVTAVTIVGLPLAVITALLFAMALYVAPVLPATWLGETLLTSAGTTPRWAAVRSFLLGGTILGITMLVPLLGLLARLAAMLLGFGAVVAARRTAGRPRAIGTQ